MANGAVVRTHERKMLDIIDLEDGPSNRRHLEQVRFRTNITQEETRNLKPEQLPHIELMKLLPTVKGDLEHAQESTEPKNASDAGKDQDQERGAIESNRKTEKRLEPPPTASSVRRRRYRPPEGFVPRRSERIRERNRNVDIIIQGGCSESYVRYTWVSTCVSCVY